jgi:hypothetical protein
VDSSGRALCPGCGVGLPDRGLEPDRKFNASGECRDLFNELSYYTLAHGDPRFLHQHAIDAYEAQHLRESGPTITGAFSLGGLCLALERGCSGRQVQKMHMRMANRSKDWPRFPAPTTVGALTVADVVAAEPGIERDQRIVDWCRSVWEAWSAEQPRVREMLDRVLD